eukprot:443630_1
MYETLKLCSSRSLNLFCNWYSLYMRVPKDPDTTVDPIFIVSIIQSVISMTNSILNNDYTQMQKDKWKRHKQRLPPTWECFKHALSRLSEVAYRIGLLSLFWCVCG